MSINDLSGYRVGLALGSGSSRGWSHIGVIKTLMALGIEPDIVCGCSIGALVGAAYSAGNLHKLENWLLKLSKLEVARFLELNWSFNGFVDAGRLEQFLTANVCRADRNIEELEKTFAVVSTDLESGREVWFTKGPVIKSVWASIALPGLFPPIEYNNKWLVDGGLVNPVPVSICRALGADFVIAVNLNGDIMGRHVLHKRQQPSKENQEEEGFADWLIHSIREYSSAIFPDLETDGRAPGLFDAIVSSINITQDRITRSRMAGDPPDVLLSPKLSHIGLMEFHRASEAIREGEACVQRMLPELRYVLNIT